jgi:hypothetical protein
VITAPVLVLGSGQRCGSTLVQRLLSSHPDMFIWGEHEAQMAPLLELLETLQERERTAGREPREAYQRLGHQSFMANLMPDAAAITRAGRRFVTELFAEPARATGRHRWGFKETSYRLGHAEGLRALFPDLRVVHLTRDPRAVLMSLDEWERTAPGWDRASTRRALRDWVEVNESLVDPPGWVASHRYEDVVAEPEAFTRELAAFVDLDHERLDRGVFEVRLHRSGASGQAPRELRAFDSLPGELRALLDDERLRLVARRYGYNG